MRTLAIVLAAVIGSLCAFLLFSESPREAARAPEIVATLPARPNPAPYSPQAQPQTGIVAPVQTGPAPMPAPPPSTNPPAAIPPATVSPVLPDDVARAAQNAADPAFEPHPSLPPAVTGHIGAVPDDLLAKRLTLPVTGIRADELVPAFFDARGERGHEAIDIIAPRGRPVVAVEDGKIARLFTSAAGGLTVYQFDPTEKYTYYYAHLDAYAPGLAEGALVKRGQILGTVGSTGNAAAAGPHLHFAISLLGPDKKWWGGMALDPYPALVRR